MTFTSLAVRTASRSQPGGVPRHVGFVLALVLAVTVGFVASGASTLITEYNFAYTLESKAEAPLNTHAVSSSPRVMMDAYLQYMTSTPSQRHESKYHVAIGVAITGFLGAMRLRFAAWPLPAVGYLLVYTWPMQQIWFSVFIGWLLKTVVVRLGGPTMIRSARPMFMGIIVGECLAAAFWLSFALARTLTGGEYFTVRLMPG